MPVSADIYSQIQRPQPVNQLANMAQALQLQGAVQQNKLAELAMQDRQRGIDTERGVNDAYRSALGPDGGIDRNALYKNLAGGGYGAKLPAIQKGFAEQDKSMLEVDEKKFKLASDRYEKYLGAMGSLANAPDLSKDMVIQAGQQLVQMGILPPEMFQKAVAGLPDDPNQLRMKIKQGTASRLTPEQMMTVFAPKPARIDTGQQIITRDENPNSPTYGQATGGAPVQKMQTPESIASNATAIRGQDKTDQRARDFNAIQQDANNIKRTEAQATANLTKNSQIASFDTMLGTLDRLESHPGLARSVGVTGAFPTMPGTPSANFQAELNTFQSQAFLPMVAQLKGMGALSDAEGKKLTAAVGALDPRMGEVAFRESVARIKEDMEAARMRMAGSRRTPKPKGRDASGSVIDRADAILNGSN